MAEPDKLPEPPKEQKPTLTEQAIEDLSWEIPGARFLLNFFIREGKVVKNGWLAFAVIVGITIWLTHSWTNRDVDSKISTATNYISGELAKKETKISTLKGELSDAKQDRDKYQLLLAPFEAMAISKYTNAPLDQRLELYSQTLSAITNKLESDRPIIHLEINGQKIVGYDSPRVGMTWPAPPFLLNKNRQIAMRIFNDSDVSAEHINISFTAVTDTTNILADQWILEPINNGANHWHIVAIDSVDTMATWFPQTVTVSQAFNQPNLEAQIVIHADRSRTRLYPVTFIFPK
jgi:hypothetical protein